MKAAGTVGKNVHDLIISREMSVKEFAKSIGVSSMTVYLWIEGKRLPRWYAIERIERMYGVWILTNEECHAELSGKAIGKNIRNLVLKRGMSYMCFGELIGSSGPTVGKWIAGEYTPSLGALIRISEAFGVDIIRLAEDA